MYPANTVGMLQIEECQIKLDASTLITNFEKKTWSGVVHFEAGDKSKQPTKRTAQTKCDKDLDTQHTLLTCTKLY